MGYDLGFDAQTAEDAIAINVITGFNENAYDKTGLFSCCGWEWSDFGQTLLGAGEFDLDKFCARYPDKDRDEVEEYAKNLSMVPIGRLAGIVDAAEYIRGFESYKMLEEKMNYGESDIEVEDYFYYEIMGLVPDEVTDLVSDLERYNAITDPAIAKAVREADLEQAQKVESEAKAKRRESMQMIHTAAMKINDGDISLAVEEILREGPWKLYTLVNCMAPVIKATMDCFGPDYEIIIVHSY